MLHTRMTVPFSEDVARMEPVELVERKEMGALCAWMTLARVSERVENKRTSPDWFWGEVDAGGGTDVAVVRVLLERAGVKGRQGRSCPLMVKERRKL